MPTLHPVFYTLLASALTFAAAWFWKRYDARQTAVRVAAEAKSAWRQGRLDAEQALRDTQKSFEAQVLVAKLKTEQDLAAITGILKEFAEAQRLLTGLASETRGLAGRVDRHDKQFDQYNDSLDAIREHIHELAMKQNKP